jgi:uncharacterized protein (DUF924 family)
MSQPVATESEEVLDFWFGEIRNGFPLEDKSTLWFQTSDANDDLISRRFGELLLAAEKGDRDNWAATPRGRLALIILLDQHSRHIYRGTAQAFAFDGKALELARQGIEWGQHNELEYVEQSFFFMPFEHSEKFADQQFCVGLFNTLLEEVPAQHKERAANSLQWAQQHRDIIKQFGRFPHRNAVLNRESTPEEKEYLAQGASAFGQ